MGKIRLGGDYEYNPDLSMKENWEAQREYYLKLYGEDIGEFKEPSPEKEAEYKALVQNLVDSGYFDKIK